MKYKKYIGFPGVEYILSETKKGAIRAYNRAIISLDNIQEINENN